MGKTRNLNGEKTKTSTIRNVEKTKTEKSRNKFIRLNRADDRILDAPSTGKMKSGSGVPRFIPGPWNIKRTQHERADRGELTPPVTSLLKNSRVSISAADNLHLSGTPCSSVSSLDTLVSLDSGIDCGSVSTSSLGSVESFSDIMKSSDPVPRGRAPIASPEDDLLSEKNVHVYEVIDKNTCNSGVENSSTKLNQSSMCSTSDIHSNSIHNSFVADSSDSESDESPHDTPVQSDSESDSDDEQKSHRRRRRRSYSDSDSDSDFDETCDFFSMSQTMNSSKLNVKDKTKSKKLSRSTSKLNLSFKKLVRSGSKLDLSLKRLIKGGSRSNLKDKNKSDSNISIPQLKESPRKVWRMKPPSGKKSVPKVKSQKKNPLNMSLPNSSVSSFRNYSAASLSSSSSSLSRTSSNGKNFHNVTMDSLRGCKNVKKSQKFSSFPVKPSHGFHGLDNMSQSDSDSVNSFHGSGSSSTSSSDSIYGNSFRGPNPKNGRSGIKLGNSVKKLKRSRSDCSNKPIVKTRTNLFSDHDFESCNVRQLLSNNSHDGGSRTVRQVLNNSPALKVRSKILPESSYDIDIDTCKSPAEVQQAMEKTAFWIENNDYDKTPNVSSTESLLQTSQDVTEADLCNQIIGIYFGEENDSDSSLSSSCLDVSLDTSIVPDENAAPIMSTPLETNLDDFTVAKFVPAVSKTNEAKTRRIVSEESRKRPAVPVDSLKEKTVLKEKYENSDTSRSSKKHHHHRKKYLNEDEIDTITKIHTICNGQRAAQFLDLNDIPMNFNHYPPPKRASKVAWDQDLYRDEYIHHTPPSKMAQPRPILQQKPKDFTYPYQEDEPSPIVITKLRRSKSMPRKSREWPW